MLIGDTVAGRPTIDAIKLIVQANCVPLLRGRAGIGKSELLAQSAEELGCKYIVRDLSLMEPPDLIGIPSAVKGRTVYQPPSFLPDNGRGILAFEELNRCPQYMRAPTLQLLTARCLNDYRLPDGWHMAAAVNPDEEDYEVQELDTAVISRFVVINVVPNATEWLGWARKNKVHPKVCNYVRSRERNVFAHPLSNPRSWSQVSSLLLAYERLPEDARPAPSALAMLIKGTVEPGDGASFARFLFGEDPPLRAEDILDRYGAHREKVNTWLSDGRIDLLEESWHNLRIHLLDEEDTYRNVCSQRSRAIGLADFLSDIPPEIQEEAREEFRANGRDFPLNREPEALCYG